MLRRISAPAGLGKGLSLNTMTKNKIASAIVLALLALFELGNFAGNLATAADSEAFDSARQALDVSSLHQALRLAFLIPISGVISLLAVIALFAVLQDRFQLVSQVSRPLPTALALLGVFHIVFTGFVAGSGFGLFGLVFLILAYAVWRLLL